MCVCVPLRPYVYAEPLCCTATKIHTHKRCSEVLVFYLPVFYPLLLLYMYFTGAAGHFQLGELHCSPTAAWAQCAYLARFPTWWDRNEVMRDRS